MPANSGRQLRIVPYNGNRAYNYYLDGYKVNGKRKRLCFKDEAAAGRKPRKPVSARYAAVTLTSSVMIRPSSQTKAIPPSSSLASGSW
jgi:hypothetical protein